MGSEDFRGQVHHDQHSIPFWPEPGDIIFRKVIDHDSLDDDHESDCVIATFGIVELYKDNYYAYPERCPDSAKRAAYHRIYFRNGDHIIRRTRFSRQNNYNLKEEDEMRVWVYWPGYQFHNTFVRLISWGSNRFGVLTLQPPDGRSRFRFRAQTFRFPDNSVMWEPGDVIVRYFVPGPPGAPNPGWYRLIGVQEVDEVTEHAFLNDGDILIKHKARQEVPFLPTDPVRMNTRMEVYAFVFKMDRGQGERWTYLSGDTMLYDFNNWDTVMNLPRIDSVPQPADIMISLNEEFTSYDPEVSHLGGYVKFYQNPATSIDPEVPSTILYNPTREPEDGATTSSAPPPNLRRPEVQPGWISPSWDHLAVPVPDAAHPYVLRFGRWAEETSPYEENAYKWIWNPYIELYARHPRANDGETYFVADRTGINYGEGRGHPGWDEFSHVGLDMFGFWPSDFSDTTTMPILLGDVVIRRDLRNPRHPILTHTLMPATNSSGPVRSCPGDLLLRYGLIKDPNADPHDAEARNRYHFGVELWVLMLDNQVRAQWSFRGRDQVIFGFFPNPSAKRQKLQAEPNVLAGLYTGQRYNYGAPRSMSRRTSLLAREQGRGIPVGAAQAQARRRSRSQGLSTEEEEDKENRGIPRSKFNFTSIEPTRQKLNAEVLIPQFLNHETGNYNNIISEEELILPW